MEILSRRTLSDVRTTSVRDRVRENAPRGAPPCRCLDGGARSIWHGASPTNPVPLRGRALRDLGRDGRDLAAVEVRSHDTSSTQLGTVMLEFWLDDECIELLELRRATARAADGLTTAILRRSVVKRGSQAEISISILDGMFMTILLTSSVGFGSSSASSTTAPRRSGGHVWQLRRGARCCGRDRRDVGGQAEVSEDVCGEV